MKADFLCRHCLLLSRNLVRRSLFDHAHDVALLSHDEILAVDFDLGSRPLSEQHSVANFDIQRTELAVIVPGAGPGGNDFALHWLFLGGIGDNNTACRFLLLLDATDEYAILQRSKFHSAPPYVSSISNARLASRRERLVKDGVRGPHLQALAHTDPRHSSYRLDQNMLGSFFGNAEIPLEGNIKAVGSK